MSTDLVTEARNKAGNYFREGYNCAESVFLAFRELAARDVEAGMVRICTGFGGGLGHSGCVCGALAASAMIINLLKGRTDCSMDREIPYELVRQFHDRFEERFGGTCCRVLNPYEYETPENLRNCLKITGNTAKLLMEFLTEKKLAG